MGVVILVHRYDLVCVRVTVLLAYRNCFGLQRVSSDMSRAPLLGIAVELAIVAM